MLLEAQFELLMAMFCAAIGPAAALGLVRPTSLAALLPEAFVRGYGVMVTMAGLAIALGLRTGVPRWPVCSGLNLLGFAVAVYAVAIIAWLGVNGAAPAGLFSAVALLSWLRSFVISTSLREREVLAAEARR